jgi:thiamine biosynthesis lipoprotein
LLLTCLLAGCVTNPVALQRYEFQRPEMGLPFRIVLHAPDGTTATNAAEAAFARIAELNSILSDYEEGSELSRLSRSSGSGQAVAVSPDLWQVLAKSEEVSRASDGAFDLTVGPFVQLWKRARRQRELPTTHQIATARASVGWRYVELDAARHTALLRVPHMRLDPGGIAKGYALDEAAKVLRARGVDRFLVSGGGDMVAGEPPPGQRGWRVEVGVFDTTNAPSPRFVSLRNYALATSGDVFQRAEIGGVRYSHIVDPHTGLGLTDHSLVTMLAPTGITADALSKVVSVLGPERGLPRLKSFPGVEALAMRRPGPHVEEHQTAGFGRWLDRKPSS